jgi:hypothetical protein
MDIIINFFNNFILPIWHAKMKKLLEASVRALALLHNLLRSLASKLVSDLPPVKAGRWPALSGALRLKCPFWPISLPASRLAQAVPHRGSRSTSGEGLRDEIEPSRGTIHRCPWA